MTTRALSVLSLALLWSGCSDVPNGTDAGSDVPVSTATDAPIAPGTDAPVAPGTDAPLVDGGAACVPSPGTETVGGYCASLELAVFTYDDRAAVVRLYGRLIPGGVGTMSCSTVDEVEVLEGSTSRGTIAGTGTLSAESESLLAMGPALDAITARCMDDTRRFGGFGLLVRGRLDGGTFEARCADAEGGSRWPPPYITCHHNVEARPTGVFANVQTGLGPGYTEVSLSVPHGPGGALSSVEGSIHVVPAADSFAGVPIAPFDTTGWEAIVNEDFDMTRSQLHFVQSGAVFSTDLCPTPSAMPGPGDTLPPVFLVGVRGSGGLGAFRTEALASYCFTSAR